MLNARRSILDTGRGNPASGNAVLNYRRSSVMTADPRNLILIAYDRAIAGYRQRDLEIAGRAVTELINGLNMDAGDIAKNLLGIYQYCGELGRKGQCEDAAGILQELRDTWAAVGDVKNS